MVEKQPNQVQAVISSGSSPLMHPSHLSPFRKGFLVAGLTIEKDRVELAPQTANELIFLHDALPAIRNYEVSFHAQ
jgi:hypothetical protein